MTVVMAFNLQSSIQILADTRATCNQTIDRERGVKKIIPITTTNQATFSFIGVSGNLDNVKIILREFSERYRVLGVPYSVQSSHRLLCYLLEELSTQVDFSKKNRVSLILCGFDQLDEYDKLTSIIVEYDISGKKQVKVTPQPIASIIGSGKKHRKKLFNIFGKNLQYKRDLPRQGLFLNGHLASAIYEDTEDQGVGGPFQLITIQRDAPDKFIEDVIWAEESGFGLAETQQYDKFTLIEHPNTPNDCKLYNLWNWQC